MSQLEPPERSEATDGAPPRELSVPGVDGTVTLPDDATAEEATALAASLAAHLGDRERAAAATAASRDGVECVDQWRFGSRLRSYGKRRLPRDVERGEEWKAAARALPR